MGKQQSKQIDLSAFDEAVGSEGIDLSAFDNEVKKKPSSQQLPTTGINSGSGSDSFSPTWDNVTLQPQGFDFAKQSNPELQATVAGQKQATATKQSKRLAELNQVYDKAQGSKATENIQKKSIERPVDTIMSDVDIDNLPYDGRALNVAKGLNIAYEGLLKTPRFLYGLGAAPQNFLADKLDMPKLAADYDNFLALTNTPFAPASPLTMLDQLGDYYKGKANEYGEKTRKYDTTIMGAIQDGNFKQAGNQILDQIAESAPSIAVMSMTAGAGNAAKLGEVSKTLANALPFMSQQNAQLEDNKDIPSWLKPVNATLNGLSEVIFDQSFGTQAAIQGIVNRFTQEGRDAAVNAAKELTGSFLNGALKSAKIIKPFINGAVEEGSTQLAQNIVDKYTVNPDINLMDGVGDAMLVGAAMTGGITTVGEIALPKQRARVSELETQQRALLTELDNHNITPEAKEGVTQMLEDNHSTIESIAKETREAIDKLNPAQKKEVTEINNKIVQAENIVNDPSVSEDVKAAAEQQVESLSKQVEAIKPEETAVESKTTPIKKADEVTEGDTVELINGKRGTVQSVEGNQISMLMDDGSTLTTNPDIIELSKLAQESPDTVKELEDYVKQADEIYDQHVRQAEIETDPVEKAELEDIAAQSKQLSDNAKQELNSLRGEEKPIEKTEKELEKEERESVFNVPLSEASKAIDELNRIEKEKPNGYGSFMEPKDGRESKVVIDKYNNASELSDGELSKDFREALFGNPLTWYADGLKLRESIKEQVRRGKSVEEITDSARQAFIKDGYSEDVANEQVARMLEPILKDAKTSISQENKLLENENKQPVSTQENLVKENIPQEGNQESITKVKPEESEGKLTTLKNAEVAQKRADYGFDERVPAQKQTNTETEAKADKAISQGYDVKELIDRINQGEPVTAEESVILAKYQGTLQDKLIDINTRTENNIDTSVGSFERLVDERNKVLDDLLAAYDASEKSGTVAGRALQARKIAVLQDYSLANLFIRKRKALGNQQLSEAQKQEVIDVYAKLKETEDAYNARIEQLKEANSKLEGELASEKMKREVNADKRRNKRVQTKEVIKKERDQILSDMKALVRKSLGNVSANPIPVEMVPLIGKLARNYFADGVTSIEQIVDNIHGQMVDLVEGVTKRDVRDAISGYGMNSRPTRDDLRQNIIDLKNQAKLISQIEDAEAGLKKAKTPERIAKVSDEVSLLRARLKDLTRSDDALDAMKKRVSKQIKETQTKLEAKDYSKKPTTEYELDDEAKRLQTAYRKIKFDFDVAVQKDILNNRTRAQKYIDMAVDLGNIPRSLMATADLSAPLRQAAVVTVAHPVVASKAFAESLRQWASPAKADAWLGDLKESDGYTLMKDSKLYIADKTNAKVSAREEEFMSNIAEKIPLGLGKLVAASERAYVGYLNKMRVDLFTRGVDVLQDQGMTYANNPQAYKALAKYINSVTGRGELPELLNTAAPVLNAAFFSPRLMASRISLLTNIANPSWYKNTPAPVRNMYFSDMAKFIGLGITVLALAKFNGADVEDDPRSPDFGKIRVGDTRWDIWAGFQQYVRFAAQLITGEKKSTASGKITKLDGTSYTKETRGSLVTNFFRGKLSPLPAFAVNALTGTNQIGEPFSVQTELPKMIEPLVSQGIRESAKSDGWPFALTATGIPSILGVGVQTYGVNNFLQKGVDDKVMDLLKAKKAVAIEPKEGDKDIYDINTGEERKMNSTEFKKYYDVWSSYIKDDIKDKYDLYKDLSPSEFENVFRSMKVKASKLAKVSVMGIADADRTIEVEDVKYELTPEQIKERKAFTDEFIKDNKEELTSTFKERNDEIKDLPKAQQLKLYMTDADIKIKIRSIANQYSKAQILDKYVEDGNVKLNKKE